MEYSHKVTSTFVVAVDKNGNTVYVPRGEKLLFGSELRDWRKLRVVWNGHTVVISRGAWDLCMPPYELLPHEKQASQLETGEGGET